MTGPRRCTSCKNVGRVFYYEGSVGRLCTIPDAQGGTFIIQDSGVAVYCKYYESAKKRDVEEYLKKQIKNKAA